VAGSRLLQPSQHVSVYGVTKALPQSVTQSTEPHNAGPPTHAIRACDTRGGRSSSSPDAGRTKNPAQQGVASWPATKRWSDALLEKTSRKSTDTAIQDVKTFSHLWPCATAKTRSFRWPHLSHLYTGSSKEFSPKRSRILGLLRASCYVCASEFRWSSSKPPWLYVMEDRTVYTQPGPS
jgi:hypothetical protein